MPRSLGNSTALSQLLRCALCLCNALKDALAGGGVQGGGSLGFIPHGGCPCEQGMALHVPNLGEFVVERSRRGGRRRQRE